MIDEKRFNVLYNDALIKAAIGVHIIKTVGPRAGVTEEVQNMNIRTLCDELARGARVNEEIVFIDVMNMYEGFPKSFFQYPDVMRLTGQLMCKKQRQNLIQNPC